MGEYFCVFGKRSCSHLQPCASFTPALCPGITQNAIHGYSHESNWGLSHVRE